MKALWESLAYSTQNLTLSSLSYWNPSFKFLTPSLLPWALQCLLGVFTAVQGPNAHLFKYSQKLTCQRETLSPSPEVLGPALLVSTHRSPRQWEWRTWVKSKELSQPTCAQVGSCSQPYILKRARPLNLWHSFFWHNGKMSSPPKTSVEENFTNFH